MAIESSLPENLTERALSFQFMLRGYHEAENSITNAIVSLRITAGRTHPMPADESTLTALDIALKCVRADLVRIEKLSDAANRIADISEEKSNA